MVDLHGHDGECLRLHGGDALDGLDLLQEIGLRRMAGRLPLSVLVAF